jgi:acetoin:2,6-dichlorophenolindophenol oxidoreductase subunit alpha
VTSPEARVALPREQLIEFLGEMLVIRRFEEKVTERFRAGDLAGFLHSCIGQEAVAVGVCRALGDHDVMGSTHRAHGHVIANGTPPSEVMAELYGKTEGVSHGYGGSMHLYDVKRGTMGANAVVGGGLPAAVGAALAFKLRGEPRVSLAFFGDGATNIGTFHESMNLAQLWHLPVVFVCENNHWSESTPQRQHQPIEDLTLRAAAYGMEALHVDGQDVEAVHLSALEALEHARTRLEPVFLVCETERLTGHYIGDPQVYRDKEELRRLRATRDPIENLRERLSVGDAEWERLDGAAHRVADEAVELAKAGTDPDPADALEYVYSEER